MTRELPPELETIEFKAVVTGTEQVPVNLTREEQRALVAETLEQEGLKVSSVLWP